MAAKAVSWSTELIEEQCVKETIDSYCLLEEKSELCKNNWNVDVLLKYLHYVLPKKGILRFEMMSIVSW